MSKLTRSKPKIFQPMESSNLSCVEPGVRCKQALIAADDGVLPVTDELAEYIEKDEIEYDDWDGDWDYTNLRAANGSSSKSAALSQRFESLVSLGPLQIQRVSHAGSNALSAGERRAEQARHSGLSRDERATTEHVLDPRTRLLLFKLLNSGVLQTINGCVSTGKEANVYHAFSPQGEVAVKVYKTSVLTFKDRDRYVSGEFRWRHGYCRSNPRKMVRVWAEKEMRNYRRLHLANVLCPEPLLLREHVLLMRFLGEDGFNAPRLKDARFSTRQAASACMQTMLHLRAIFIECRLVHGDFSEYNLLWYNKKVWVIDVSQAVEHDHPNALLFLRKDCENMIVFFRRLRVAPLPSLQQLFDFVTDPNLRKGPLGTWEEACEEMLMAAEAGPSAVEGEAAVEAAEAEVVERVFAQMYIPRTLEELNTKQIERDVTKAEKEKGTGGPFLHPCLKQPLPSMHFLVSFSYILCYSALFLSFSYILCYSALYL